MLRPAHPNDAVTIAKLYVDVRRDTVPSIHSVQSVTDWLRDQIIPLGGCYVWEADGEIQGWMNIRPGHLDHLFCRRGATGQGIGSQLMAFAKSQSPEGLELWTFAINDGARRFYQRHGFIEVEWTDGHNNEENTPDVRLIWRPETISEA